MGVHSSLWNYASYLLVLMPVPPFLPSIFLSVIPMYQTFSSVFPGSEPLLAYVMRNYKHWADEQK